MTWSAARTGKKVANNNALQAMAWMVRVFKTGCRMKN
jgi:hypothetical protein